MADELRATMCFWHTNAYEFDCGTCMAQLGEEKAEHLARGYAAGYRAALREVAKRMAQRKPIFAATLRDWARKVRVGQPARPAVRRRGKQRQKEGR